MNSHKTKVSFIRWTLSLMLFSMGPVSGSSWLRYHHLPHWSAFVFTFLYSLAGAAYLTHRPQKRDNRLADNNQARKQSVTA